MDKYWLKTVEEKKDLGIIIDNLTFSKKSGRVLGLGYEISFLVGVWHLVRVLNHLFPLSHFL